LLIRSYRDYAWDCNGCTGAQERTGIYDECPVSKQFHWFSLLVVFGWPLFASIVWRDSAFACLRRSPSLSFSDYIIYVDESGDHGLQTLDSNYPVFVLAFCIFHKRYYSDTVIPAYL